MRVAAHQTPAELAAWLRRMPRPSGLSRADLALAERLAALPETPPGLGLELARAVARARVRRALAGANAANLTAPSRAVTPCHTRSRTVTDPCARGVDR